MSNIILDNPFLKTLNYSPMNQSFLGEMENCQTALRWDANLSV